MTDESKSSVSPFVVGVSGHRDLHPDALQYLRDAVATILKELKGHLPDSELRMMAGMAAGADLLAVQTALELGLGVDAVLPMPLAQYAADFDSESLSLLESLLAHPRTRRRELRAGNSSDQDADGAAARARRDARYATLSQNLSHGCSLLIALWDGEASLLPGGTADTVLRFLGVRTDLNKDDDRLHFSTAQPEGELPERLVYWIPAARAKRAVVSLYGTPCFLAGLGDNKLQRLSMMSRRLERHLRLLDAYNRFYRREDS